jgi:molybdate-binding protein/transcriptional regulator with XRE-family HTH domain
MLANDVKLYRSRRGWSQDDLARRAGISRAGVSGIETGRLIPSTAAALALAAALECSVESLFRLAKSAASAAKDDWAWRPTAVACRYWRAEVAGRRLCYPVEYSPLGLVPHDGVYKDGVFHDRALVEPTRTLVLACCDPAASLLAAELAQSSEHIRLIVLSRSSRVALDLLAQGLVHAAGIHLARSDCRDGNAATACSHLTAGRGYQLLHVADWDEGIALAPNLRLNTVESALAASLRWVGRETGSGAERCLAELLAASGARSPVRRAPLASDHRGVAQAIRSRWADAGICLRLASEEANLSFLSVRQEAYEICVAEESVEDRCTRALVSAIRSTSYRRAIAELPGYDTDRTGARRRIKGQGARRGDQAAFAQQAD